jgi:hypothetical protein
MDRQSKILHVVLNSADCRIFLRAEIRSMLRTNNPIIGGGNKSAGWDMDGS